jgi:hypothetical protein
MVRKLLILFSVAAVLLIAGCVKETYNMDRLSKWGHLSPTFAISAARGNISLSDLIDPNDTVVFDADNFIRFVFRKDSVIEFKMADYYDLNDMVSFNKSYDVGVMSIAPFSGSVSYTLDAISLKFSPSTLRDQFVALDGTTANFPGFSTTILNEITYASFSNFEYALLKEGSIDVIVKNNLTAPIYGATVSLYNAIAHSLLGTANITQINPGLTGMATIDVGGKTVRNQMIAAVTINGSPGTTTPVLIDLDGSNIEVEIDGRDMKVISGRVILPDNPILPDGEYDTVTFDPGTGIEITEFDITTGNLSYTLHSSTTATASVNIELPTIKRSGIPITKEVSVSAGSTVPGTINVDNTIGKLDIDNKVPFNRIPIKYTIIVHSSGAMINFSSFDQVQLDLGLLNPDFDYVKGYFGLKTETIDPDTLDLGIKEVLDHISGSFLITNPSIKLNYRNSFAIPIKIDLQATGYKKAETVDLNLVPFILDYPAAPSERDINAMNPINKGNSNLPALVSMPPEKVRFAGSAIMNPGGNTGARNNYIFGNSRFVGGLEIEVPLELRINDLQFSDTLDNFLQNNDSGDSPIKPEDFEFLRIDITAENGFPLGISLSMVLWDSASNSPKCTIDASDILEPAPVDISGKVTTPKSCATSIDITRDFWNSVNEADKIIFTFTMNTTDAGSKDVKIYSDYKIDFKAALVLKPDIRFKF